MFHVEHYTEILIFIIFLMSKVISFANQKGGVGKTTNAVNLAAELGLRGHNTLLIDLDPQQSATSGMGHDPSQSEKDLYTSLVEQKSELKDLLVSSNFENVSLIPGCKDLVSIEYQLGETTEREFRLQKQLESFKSNFDFILIDCPPSNGLLTINALVASDKIFIPLQAEFYSLEGLTQLMETLQVIKESCNPSIDILGVLVTMFDSRTRLSNDVLREAREFLGDLVFSTVLPRLVKIGECPSFGRPISYHDPSGRASQLYRELTDEVLARLKH